MTHNRLRSVRIAVPGLSQALAGFFVLSVLAESIDVALLPLFEHFSEVNFAPALFVLAGLSIAVRTAFLFGGFSLMFRYTLANSFWLTQLQVGLTIVTMASVGMVVVVGLLLLQMNGVIECH
jgi:hypothetical protein